MTAGAGAPQSTHISSYDPPLPVNNHPPHLGRRKLRASPCVSRSYICILYTVLWPLPQPPVPGRRLQVGSGRPAPASIPSCGSARAPFSTLSASTLRRALQTPCVEFLRISPARVHWTSHSSQRAVARSTTPRPSSQADGQHRRSNPPPSCHHPGSELRPSTPWRCSVCSVAGATTGASFSQPPSWDRTPVRLRLFTRWAPLATTPRRRKRRRLCAPWSLTKWPTGGSALLTTRMLTS